MGSVSETISPESTGEMKRVMGTENERLERKKEKVDRQRLSQRE